MLVKYFYILFFSEDFAIKSTVINYNYPIYSYLFYDSICGSLLISSSLIIPTFFSFFYVIPIPPIAHAIQRTLPSDTKAVMIGVRDRRSTRPNNSSGISSCLVPYVCWFKPTVCWCKSYFCWFKPAEAFVQRKVCLINPKEMPVFRFSQTFT